MSDWIVFENWPWELIERRQRDKHFDERQERMLVLRAEYYGRGKTDDQKARSIGLKREQYWHLKKKYGLLEDDNGYLRKPKEYTEEWWDNQDTWYDN